MSEERGLLDAIRESPEDDGLRLIYADWLEDDGQSDRAEFIRAQIAIHAFSGAGCPADDPRRVNLHARQEELLRRHKGEWLAALPGIEGIQYRFRRGLPGDVAFATWELFTQHALDISRIGLIEQLSFTLAIRAESLAVSPAIQSLTRLDLPNKALGDPGAIALASSPYLRKLTTLNLSGNSIGPVGITALADSPILGGVRHLNLNLNPMGNAGLRALIESRHTQSLRGLTLFGTQLGPDGAREFARAKRLPYLEHLDLSSNVLTDAGMAELAIAPGRALSRLGLSRCQIKRPGATFLVGAPLLAALRWFDLSANELEDAGLMDLLSGNSFASVEHLMLQGCALSNRSAVGLAECEGLTGLRTLELERNGIGAEGARALASSRYLAGLEHLDLTENPITNQAKEWLYEKMGDRVRV